MGMGSGASPWEEKRVSADALHPAAPQGWRGQHRCPCQGCDYKPVLSLLPWLSLT